MTAPPAPAAAESPPSDRPALLARESGQRLAWGLWLLLFAVVTVLVAVQPHRRTVTPSYVAGTRAFWAGHPMYDRSSWGFLYPPPFAVLYTPFVRVPAPLGDVLWRWLNLGLFLGAVVRLAALPRARGGPSLFALVSVLALPASLSSARNGQVNMTEAALMAHAAVDLALGRLWRPAALLAVASVLKPIALVAALLAGALRPAFLWRFTLALGLGLTLPFAFASAPYVVSQYAGFVEKMRVAAALSEPSFCDLGGLLYGLGLDVPEEALRIARAVAAPAALALAWRAWRRVAEPERSLHVLGLAAVYLMLMSPRTETNGYVILSPVVATFAARRWNAPGATWTFWLLVVIALGLGADNYPFHRQTDLWLKPALALAFAAWLVWSAAPAVGPVAEAAPERSHS